MTREHHFRYIDLSRLGLHIVENTLGNGLGRQRQLPVFSKCQLIIASCLLAEGDEQTLTLVAQETCQ